jgi:ribose 5-phosphate isomerase B
MIIAIGCDHGGYPLKEKLVEFLRKAGHEILDRGSFTPEMVDYPDIARNVADSVLGGQADRGILLCGTGLGMSISANRIHGIRAALCTNEYMARMSRAHNDANILVLGARVVGSELAKSIVQAYLAAQFEGGRHKDRIEQLEQISPEKPEGEA